MSYDLEAINTLFAQIVECMHRNPARAMRLLGQAKAKVRESLERAAIPRGALAAHKPGGGDVLELLKDARHRIANLSRAAVPFDDPLDGPVLRRLDAAISAQQRQGEGGE